MCSHILHALHNHQCAHLLKLRLCFLHDWVNGNTFAEICPMPIDAHKCDSAICISIWRDLTRVSHKVTESHAVGGGLTAQTTGTAAALQGEHTSLPFPLMCSSTKSNHILYAAKCSNAAILGCKLQFKASASIFLSEAG